MITNVITVMKLSPPPKKKKKIRSIKPQRYWLFVIASNITA